MNKVSEIEPREMVPGYFARFIHSERMTFCYWRIDKDAPLPEHSHEHEQVAHMLKGEFRLIVDGHEYHMKPGDVVTIPSNAVHSGVALTDCEILDCFAPVREDYR